MHMKKRRLLRLSRRWQFYPNVVKFQLQNGCSPVSKSLTRNNRGEFNLSLVWSAGQEGTTVKSHRKDEKRSVVSDSTPMRLEILSIATALRSNRAAIPLLHPCLPIGACDAVPRENVP
jgi:hypothetical protein